MMRIIQRVDCQSVDEAQGHYDAAAEKALEEGKAMRKSGRNHQGVRSDDRAREAADVAGDVEIGGECIYLYKGPHGFAMQPERFMAKVVGFTARGSVRIKAFDHVNGEWFYAIVRKTSLVDHESVQGNQSDE